MAEGILGRKIGMTSLFIEGDSIPVTVIEAGPCDVVQVKAEDGRDGYTATQLGYLPKKAKRVTKPLKGHFKRAAVRPTKILREIRNMSGHKVGKTLRIEDLFSDGDTITVRGISKGRGFAGVMKRHNFHGHKKTHGTHESFRGAGSIGACAWPAKVIKGKRMAGHMGVDKVTLRSVEIVEMIPERNLILIKGPVPGAKDSVVELIKQ